MSHSSQSSHAEARKRLLEEGARSYNDAVTALIAFQNEVQKKCRDVLERHLEDYSSALGIQLTEEEIADTDWPSFAKWEGDDWGLGVKILRRDLPSMRWWESRCCLQWESGDTGLYCWIGEEFPGRAKVESVRTQFHKRDHQVAQGNNTLWLEHKLTTDTVTSFEEPLDSLVQRWVGLWKKVGGIKGVFKE
jgi:hypothetical protein